jgi:cytochrome P450
MMHSSNPPRHQQFREQLISYFIAVEIGDRRMTDEELMSNCLSLLLGAVVAWIASANRHESAFDGPYELDFERAPNRHVAFGSGPHLCLGSHLARLMLRSSFDELVASIEPFEIADAPVHLVSNEMAGVVSLPLRIGLRTRMMPTAS